MNWQPLKIQSQIRGFEARLQNLHFFFGTRFTLKEDLPTLFPQYEFCFLKQVHGAAVVEADARSFPTADAHFTGKKNRALVIQTADCLPILIAQENRVFAIHAGWRGIAQNIISACRPFLKGEILAASVGPHIQKSSFEVGVEVVEQLQTLGPQMKPFVFPHPEAKKCWVDLSVLAETQLQNLCGSNVTVDFLPQDTMTDGLFHSFRRGKQTPDRQYSFVVIAE